MDLRLPQGCFYLLFSALAAILLLLSPGCDFGHIDEESPAYIAREYFKLMIDKQYGSAYWLLSEDFKEDYGSYDDFLRAIDNGEVPVYFDVEILRPRIEADTAEIDWRGKMTNDKGQVVLRAGVVLMVKEGGAWRLDGIMASEAY